jgi:hypothetical protein
MTPRDYALLAAFFLALLAILLHVVPLVAARMGIPRRDAKGGGA